MAGDEQKASEGSGGGRVSPVVLVLDRNGYPVEGERVLPATDSLR